MPVLDLSPGDQTITVSGDTALLEVYGALPAGLYPPFPPVELPGGVGGLVSRGGFAQTFFFGAEVLGVTFRAPSGRVVRAGGRTVKNVQGYDLTRPFVGSFGALGEALEVTLRLRPGLTCAHDVRPGNLTALDRPPVRFLWIQGALLHSFHFGHLAEVNAASTLLGGQPHQGILDYRPLFSAGIGVGMAGPVQDPRFGWTNGGVVPPVPTFFQRLANAL